MGKLGPATEPGAATPLPAAGMVGKITKVGDTYISLEIASGTEIQMQKAAVQTLLPKGSIKAMS